VDAHPESATAVDNAEIKNLNRMTISSTGFFLGFQGNGLTETQMLI
jgi:hypothetical protein